MTLIILVGIAVAWALLPMGVGHSRLVGAKGGQVILPVGSLTGGEAHFFRYAGAGGEIAFFLVQSRDGVIHAAFDSCDVCYKSRKGYRQEGDFMVCNNCNQQFRTDLVNEVQGGCNPAPLRREVRGQQVVIQATDLEAGSRYFLAAN
ncbi:DUF2318 domain-containing protein [Desulfuromonas sp. DDH964]|uniref:DUF2318 domain-containing protein n=1 Tax=Desulfuromonas sp. DDH964 TaxID=1823759 RepID=UPI001E355506|nr:DUF2318 domain-containing protein [Desulfuromonas sp. DDH964]